MSKIHESIETANKYIEAAIEKLDTLHGADFEISSALDQLEITIKTGLLLSEKIEFIAGELYKRAEQFEPQKRAMHAVFSAMQ
jgi:hypothetical protein